MSITVRNIIEAATHMTTAGYVLYSLHADKEGSTEQALAWLTGATIGVIHGAMSKPVAVIGLSEKGEVIMNNQSISTKATISGWRGATIAVAGYSAAKYGNKYLESLASATGEIIGDIAGDTTDMIA